MSRTVEVNGAEIELTGIGQLRDFLSRVDGRTLVSITVEYTNGECHAGHGSEQCADKTGERTAEGGWSEIGREIDLFVNEAEIVWVWSV